MDGSGYRLSYVYIFYKKSIYQMSMNRVKMTTTKFTDASLMKILSFSSLYLLLNSFEEATLLNSFI